MSLKILYNYIDGNLTADISDTTTVLPIDLDTLATLQASINFQGGEWTYLQLTNTIYYEEVKVIGISGNLLSVERGQSGSTPQAFAANDTHIYTIVGAAAIKDIISANPVPSTTTVSGGGLATVDKTGTNYAVYVEPPTFTGKGGAVVTGGWPEYTINYEAIDEGCCGCSGSGGSGGGIDTLQINSTSLQGNITGSTLSLTLQALNLQAGTNISITGAYPNYTISSTGSTGGGFELSAGTGITLTGDPQSSPTVSITPTGVAAGTYAGIQVNAQGQIVSMPANFSIISTITSPAGMDVTKAGNTVTLTLHEADVGVKGIVELADSSQPFSPTEDTKAATQAVIKNALDTIKTDISYSGSYTGEPDASYTDVQTSTPIAINLDSGESVAVFAEVTVVDNANPQTPISFGCALLNSTAVKFYGHPTITQSKQNISTVISGPVNSTVVLATTAIPGTATVKTNQLVVMKL